MFHVMYSFVQVVDQSTSSVPAAPALPLSADAPREQRAPQASSIFRRCTSSQQKYDALAFIMNAEAAEAKKAIGQAKPELVFTVEAYNELIKQEGSRKLQVG
jgi:hypothetical protein